MQYDSSRISEIYLEEENKTATARAYCKEQGIEYTDSIRRKISKILASEIGETPKPQPLKEENKNETKANNYNDKKDFFLSAWDRESGKILDIKQYCEKYNLPYDQLKSFKFLPHHYSEPSYNVVFANEELSEEIFNEDFIESIVKKHIQPVEVENIENGAIDDWVDRLVVTDIHIGMATEGGRNNIPLYDNPWDEKELFSRLNKCIAHVVRFQKGKHLVIDDLGDLLDGLLGQTVRKHHDLPQNMDDKEAFETAIEFKIKLVSSLLNYYDKIVVNNITNDNHSGVFSYFVNSTIKKIIELKYENVTYNIIQRFIDHYSLGKNTFVISHGKDGESMKFGFKPKLDTKQIEKIDQYCKEYNLYNGNKVEFSIGDQHQAIFDYTTSNDFDYCAYPAFSPPSNWVKTNFKNSKSGFVFQNISLEDNTKINVPYWFKK